MNPPFSSLNQTQRLSLQVATGDALDVREFRIEERINELFEISVLALTENPDIDFDAIAGLPMSFAARHGAGDSGFRTWHGICRHVEQVSVEETGLSAYRFILVPPLWLLTQRKNYRMFQRESEVDIVKKLLSEWGIPFEDFTGAHGKREYRVQYGETDFTFLRRMLEDAGTSFYFRTEGNQTLVVLSDAPQQNPVRLPKISYLDSPTNFDRDYVTKVRPARSIQPGRYTLRDHDHRRAPSFNLKGSAASPGVEASLEQFEYEPGAFVFESDRGDVAHAGDDRGRFRADDRASAVLAERRLAAGRASARTVTFETNAIDLAPGTVVGFLDHPKTELSGSRLVLVTAFRLSGEVNGVWTCACEAASADTPFHPQMVTPRPRTSGVESATVVGPGGEEIHADELGRVRVHFHWDRESQMNERSSCWIPVSQPWGGSGFGGTNLPRIGQEVIVDFLGGNPDRPVIVGRLYTGLQTTPYKLPENKTQSGWRSRSSPGGGGDNYNEVMFEDRKGAELLRMQAERNLDKLVKNDEKVHIGNDRTKRVDHDDSLSVGNCREKHVEIDERVTIGNDRQKLVRHDESVTIGNDRTKVVEHDERSMIGNDRTKVVEHDEQSMIGRDRLKLVLKSEAVAIGLDRDKYVHNNESVTIGRNRNKQVQNNETVAIGNNRTKRVKNNETVTIGQNLARTVMGTARDVTGLSKSVVVGLSRATQVGLIDSTVAGQTISMSVSPPGEQALCLGTFFVIHPESHLLQTAAGAKASLDGTTITLDSGATITIADVTKPPLKDPQKTITLDSSLGATIKLTDEIELKVGESVIRLTKSGIVIKGPKVDITGAPIGLNCDEPKTP